jgi:hypothetical protein
MARVAMTELAHMPEPKEKGFDYVQYVINQALEKGSITFVGWINNLDRNAVQNKIAKIIAENKLPLQIEYGAEIDKVVRTVER